MTSLDSASSSIAAASPSFLAAIAHSAGSHKHHHIARNGDGIPHLGD